MKDLPVVCTLGAATIAVRKANLLPALVKRALSREDMPEGIRLRFFPDDLTTVVATIDQERQCCRFLQFDVRVDPDGGSVWLALTGPPGTSDFLRAMIDG